MRRSWLIALTTLLVAAPCVSAQHLTNNKGFMFALGVGSGSQGNDCSDCVESDTQSGFGAFVRGAWALSNPKYAVGVEALFWQHSTSAVNPNTGNTDARDYDDDYFGVMGLWYPQKHHEYFFKGGVGISHITTFLSTETNGVPEVVANPFTVQIGAGIDWNLAKSWSLSPFIDFHYGFNSSAKYDGKSLGQNLHSKMIYFGAALTWP